MTTTKAPTTMDQQKNDRQQHEEVGRGEILLLDKPLDWTSFDVVKRVRSILQIRRIGHAGTLDPKATGLLIVCTGRQTKNIHEFVGLEKEYVGTMELGVITPSFDSETEPTERRSWSDVTREKIEEASLKFVGRQLQVPPMYSASKYGGKPLYKYARKGRTVPREPKEIEVADFEIRNVVLPFVDFRITCSKGTYIRSLVHELGQALGCGATLRALRRTRIGAHTVEAAMTLEELSLQRTKLKKPAETDHARHG